MAGDPSMQQQTVGRRKTAVARVLLRPGTGKLSVNGRSLEDYFPRMLHQKRVEAFAVAGRRGHFDVRSGWPVAASRARRTPSVSAVARALVKNDEEVRSPMRRGGLLTRDPRKVERKKPGRPKARKRFQFSKR
jgi:small subunit ribosomal protein S9